MDWKPGSEHSIIVDKDMFMGIGQDALLSQDLVSWMNKKGIYIFISTNKVGQWGNNSYNLDQ
jgi:hypothetical protein